jgi:sodium-independent sulfate anion transporter 11
MKCNFFSASGQSIDATQELLALGACNFVSSFVGSMSVSGGLSRGAINHASGVRSTVSSIYTGKQIIAFISNSPFFSS